MKKTLVSELSTIVRQHSNRPALRVSHVFYTYTQLHEIALKISATLKQFSSMRCVLLNARSVFSYAGLLGALYCGKSYVPISIDLPGDRILFLFELADTDILMIDPSVEDKAIFLLHQLKKPFIVLLMGYPLLPPWCAQFPLCDFHQPMNHFYINTALSSHTPAYLMFTSGSTGIPKGVSASHGNILSYVNNIKKRSQPHDEDRFTQISDLGFDFSIHDLFVCWLSGACLYTISNPIYLSIVDFIQKYQLTCFASVPSLIRFLKECISFKRILLPSLRYSLFCGEPLTEGLAEDWQTLAPHSVIDNVYGPTEATVAITGYRWCKNSSASRATIVPIGRPFDHHRIAIVDSALYPVPLGAKGELCLSGPQIVAGYWKDHALTAQRFVTLPCDSHKKRLWYRTGDSVSWSHSVGLIYHGRMDDQLKILGCRVEKLEIEKMLQTAAQSDDVAIVPDMHVEGYVCGVIAYIAKSARSSIEIMAYCKKHLPDYMIPKKIYFIDTLPYNHNQKIDYHYLMQLVHANTKCNTSSPSTTIIPRS